MTTKELKSELRARATHVSGKKEQLIGRLLRHDTTHNNLTIVNDIKYIPKKEDKKFGIVSNLPWKYQEAVCKSFKETLYYTISSAKYSRDRSYRDIYLEFKIDLLDMMVHDPNLRDITAIYTGYTSFNFGNDTYDWDWEEDEKGNTLVDTIVKIVTDIWAECVKKHREECRRYNNPQWGYEGSYVEISKKLEYLAEKRREKIIKQDRLRKILKGTFLYGCAKKNSGSILLPLIGARYAYGPVRRKIAEYVGAVDP